ncbi:NLP-like protein [Plasmopara halstedii]|uniref:NLP-like protein n=1 Tax=Plasmopara halstedii TaxID=4781 RepID=A0A0P1AMB0_PLAHL|nr:NLP-like protein [Plasmopara halstedii]CEG42318.1 NLP-like protein [Plasmopara halstedii]|eukprot:XP_024578687.1 NLP-like protein [Plasmopara halstedii]
MGLRAIFFGGITILATSLVKAHWINLNVSVYPEKPGAVLISPTLMDVDEVQPFYQRKPTTISQESAIKYKPRLYVDEGCHPYPVVQENGSLSEGMQWKNYFRPSCEGSPRGSQIYSRSDWYQGKWAMLYTWYLPMALDSTAWFVDGHRHFWLWVVIWTDSPDPDDSTILAASMSGFGDEIKKYAPLKSKYLIHDKTLKVKSTESRIRKKHGLELTKRVGEFQDLITWEQLSDEARAALSNFHRLEKRANPPIQDKLFYEVLEKSYPF